MNECERLHQMILETLNDNLQVRHVEGACEVTLPVLDPFNDYVRFFVEKTPRGYRLTDYGLTIGFLTDNDVNLESMKQELIFDDILKSNGVANRNEILTVETTEDTAGFQKSLILYIKAITSILDMEHLKQPRNRIDFKSAVRQYIESREIDYESFYQVETRRIGKVSVDFLIRNKIALDAIHSTALSHADDLINRTYTNFEAIRKHTQEFRMAVIYNDESAVPESRRFSLLEEVTDFPPIPWKRKDEGFDKILA